MFSRVRPRRIEYTIHRGRSTAPTRQAGARSVSVSPGRTARLPATRDFEVYVRAFAKTGIRGGLNWYRNVDRNWEDSADLVERVDQPALMITAELDPVLWPEQTIGMERWVPNLKRVHIEGSGHWTQQEKPSEVNAAIIDFLRAPL